MIKYHEFRCQCGNRITFASFRGTHTNVERNLLIEEERKEVSSFDFRDFFYKKIKRKEKLYLKDTFLGKEKIRILEVPVGQENYIDIANEVKISELFLLEILEKKHKTLNFIDIIGDFE